MMVKMDFASDAKPEKNMARNMYKKWRPKLNKNYFEGRRILSGMVIGDIIMYHLPPR